MKVAAKGREENQAVRGSEAPWYRVTWEHSPLLYHLRVRATSAGPVLNCSVLPLTLKGRDGLSLILQMIKMHVQGVWVPGKVTVPAGEGPGQDGLRTCVLSHPAPSLLGTASHGRESWDQKEWRVSHRPLTQASNRCSACWTALLGATSCFVFPTEYAQFKCHLLQEASDQFPQWQEKTSSSWDLSCSWCPCHLPL